MSYTDAASFEHSNVLVTRSYKMKSHRLSTRMQEALQNVESAVCVKRSTEDGVERSECGAARPKKGQRLERGGGYLVRDGSCLSLEETVKATETRGTFWRWKPTRDCFWMSSLKSRH